MVQENMQRALDGDQSYEPYFRIVWEDKSVHHIKASGYIERDKSGKAIRMIGANTDITELKESGEKLRQSEAFSSGVLRSLSSHIAVINSSGVIIAVNEAWKRFGKLKGKSVLKRTEVGSNYFEDCKLRIKKGDITSAQALKGMLDVMNGETDLFNFEYPCCTDDDEYWFGMRVMKFDSAEPMIVVAHENITSIKNAERERDLTLIELERRVEERTDTIAKKNKDITDSINYAGRIQLGLLSSQSKLTEVFTKSFVISKPRDIVSGDFFWCYQSQSRKFIVLADCTGHGVPGALMSIIGNNLLEQIIANEHVEHPSEILELLDERLAETLKGDSGDIKDGMDLSLCLIDENFKEMYYACAFQPVFVTGKKGELRQLPASRFSIGAEFYGGTKIFETERIPFVPGTRIYLSSDGFYSQFGGENDKKLMKSGFRKMLTAMQKIPFDQQQELLSAKLSSWTEDKEQVDDILVVGIEL
jgi:serine phosphatase RsbU (regulator of sigma subunit)